MISYCKEYDWQRVSDEGAHDSQDFDWNRTWYRHFLEKVNYVKLYII